MRLVYLFYFYFFHLFRHYVSSLLAVGRTGARDLQESVLVEFYVDVRGFEDKSEVCTELLMWKLVWC